MIVVNVSRTWPHVIGGKMTAPGSILGDWAALNEAKLHQFADAILGIAEGTIVAAYDIEGWERLDNGRVRFRGHPSTHWARLVGMPSPVAWAQGAARPIRYLPTEQFGTETLNESPGAQRDGLTIRGWTLHVEPHGDAILHAPPGRSVTVVTAPFPTEDA